jgi:hypothetical protein
VQYFLTVPVALLAAASFANSADFAAEVYPMLRKAGCPACHNPDGVAAATRLTFPEADASTAAVTAFANSPVSLVNRDAPGESLLMTKPTKRVAHAGGRRIQPGSPEEALLRAWIEDLARNGGTTQASVQTAEAHKPIGPVLRRLTHTQYNNTVRDLLGDDSRIADSFPPEDFVNGFRGQYQSQSVSPLLAEAYAAAAEKLTKKAFAGDTSRFLPCRTSTAKCGEAFIGSFGRKAFRRPLAPAEVQRYRKLFAAGGARMVMEAMLQSPNFLLRTENGLQPAWRPYERASRLSYFLWNSMPDDELFRSAESGALNTPEGVEKVARRMLKDPRARTAMFDFVGEWLRFDRLANTVKDRRTYPMFTPELAVSMAEETKRLFGELVWNNRNFMEFYSADYSFLTTDLATLYGVTPPAKEYERVTLPASAERAGFLGHGTFLAVTSNPAESSPTARGLFVREQFLCQEVPQPPPGVSTNLTAVTKERPMNNRERLAAHLNNENCSSCHALIDPIGFGLEKFDAVGRHREKQTLTFRPAHGERNTKPSSVQVDIDTTGHVAGIRNSEFSSLPGLGKILAGSAQCQECVVKQLFRYAAGRHETAADRVVIRKAFDDFRRSGFLFQELLVSLSRWVIFPPGGDDGVSSH